MPDTPHIVCPWLTPKAFPDFDDPAPRARSFFDHYEVWFRGADRVVLNFCSGNGDHILNYRGRDGWDEAFEWARFNSYLPRDEQRLDHNGNWLRRVREGGERSANPYLSGPSFIVSEQVLTYRKLHGIYDALRDEAARRDLDFKLLEYLEPGPEFCECEWKTKRHPEGALGSADAGGTVIQGVIDVCSRLNADQSPYAAFPEGIAPDTLTGDFVAAQTAAFTRDFGLDGVFLGNQFGLVGFWHPENAPPPTAERRAGIKHFFHQLRREMGDHLIYWMDTYWPAEREIEQWAMSEENYAQLDAVMCSNFAVIIDPTQVVPNLESKLRLREKFGKPDVLFSLDFVDPWYCYRVYLDDRSQFLFQHETYRKHGARCQGTSFFANDTFGHWVMPQPLGETVEVVAQTHGWNSP